MSVAAIDCLVHHSTIIEISGKYHNTKSELLLIRLREAILEMNGVAGEQTHSSW